MSINQIIKNIIFLPFNLYENGKISFYDLLKETQYFEFYYQINENDILEVLKNYPECVNYWFLWSENKRTSSGWYIQMNEKGKYIVGYLHEKEGQKTVEYANVIEACSVFIKNEIEDVRR